MPEVFYYTDKEEMQRKTKEYVFIYIGSGLYVFVAYLCQHYFFSIMDENLTARFQKMMLSG
jgi:ATP-binding cassette subfamily B (MDR/TAP) protein 1